MKLVETYNKPQKSEEFRNNKFSILATGKAFRALSSSLYSYKIAAIIRELSTNALDAHKAAGKIDTPFKVHIPNRLEPYFSVRDFGTGLSHEDIVDLYCTYFSSNKTNSDEFIGCLGLGSKSPFAYDGLDNFTVDSYLNGKKASYVAFIDEDGAPNISLLNETDTTEPNGLEITISIKASDIPTFITDAGKIYKYFEKKPTIIGQNVEIESFKPVLEGEIDDIKWILEAGTNNPYSGYSYGAADSAKIVMGNICYPISSRDLTLDADCKSIVTKNLTIFVPIGSVQFAISREALDYNKATIKNLTEILSKVVIDIKNTIVIEIDSADSLFEASKLAKEKLQKSGLNLSVDSLKWKGKPLQKTFISNFANGWITSFSSIGRKKVDHFHKIEISTTNCAFVYNDLKIGAQVRCKTLLEDYDIVYCIFDPADSTKPKFDQKAFCDAIGINDSDIIPASSIDYDPVVNRRSIGKNKEKVFLLRRTSKNSSWSRNCANYWDAASIDIDKDCGFYVPIKRFMAMTPIRKDISKYIKETRPSDFVQQLNNIEHIVGIKFPQVYGIKKDLEKRFIKSPNWINLIDYLNGLIKEYLNTTKNDTILYKVRNDFRATNNQLGSLSVGLPIDFSIDSNLELINNLQKSSSNHIIHRDIKFSFFNYEEYEKEIQDDLIAKKEEIQKQLTDWFDKHPLMSYILNYKDTDSISTQEIKDYLTCTNKV